jgi:HD-GYP domain-containing protein (c-di-GMP phosphodiesterase class II)
MNLVEVTNESIVIGQPLPFALRDETGTLLARKGYVIGSRADLESMRGRGLGLYVDVSESERHQKAFVGKLMELVADDRPLGKIAQAQLTTRDLGNSHEGTAVDAHTWLDLQVQGTRLLRDLSTQNFADDLERLHQRLDRLSRRNPDGALFALFHLASSEIDLYSATHSMLVSVVCGITAREVLQWPDSAQETLCKAALTMNISMTSLQDRLASQREPPTAEQRDYIAQHPQRSVDLLRKMGQHDPDWLEAVRDHHRTLAGDLLSRSPGQQIARLLQRADIFTARLSPRASRRPDLGGAALQACYFDENRQIDVAGAALIKAVGVYSPGTLVRLTNNEIGIVVRRGANTTSPRVAVLVNRDGFATGEHVIRDTGMREFRVIASVAQHECKVKINLARLLALTSGPASNQPW